MKRFIKKRELVAIHEKITYRDTSFLFEKWDIFLKYVHTKSEVLEFT
jgi:hypothetical protein